MITFKLRYTYITSDVLIGYGPSTDPTIFGTPSDYTTDMNMSYIVDQSIRYHTNTNG